MGKALVDFSKSHYGTLAVMLVGAILTLLAQKYEWLRPLIGSTTQP